MAALSDALDGAFALLQAGKLKEAEAAYRRVLEREPGNVDALHHLGVVAFQVKKHELAIDFVSRALRSHERKTAAMLARLGASYGAMRQLDQAVAHLRQSLELWPDNAEARLNLGNALLVQGQTEAAVQEYRRAADLEPKRAHAQRCLAQALQKLERLPEAAEAYRSVLKLEPEDIRTTQRLCEVLEQLGELDEAQRQYEEALHHQPDSPVALCNLGCLLQTRGKPEEAAALYRRALEIKPELPEAHFNLGNALRDMGRHGQAVESLQQAVLLKPDLHAAYNNLALALRSLGCVEEAIQCLSRCLKLSPEYVVAKSNLGSCYQELGQTGRAIQLYEEALQLEPDYAEARCNLGITYLRQGDFERGWREYEWRWKSPGNRPRKVTQPAWDGASLAGKTIYLHTEQGMGDAIQFVRYATVLRRQAKRVLLGCGPRMASLLKTCQGVDEVIPFDQPPPQFDVHAPLLSVPGRVGTRFETIPADVPYLSVDEARVAEWKERLAPISGFRVGIAWQGNPKHLADKLRSIPLAQFAPLAALPGVQLIALQHGPGLEQLTRVDFPVVRLEGRIDADGAFLDTAAIVRQLDLVIVCDTAIGHLAGALGVPVWLGLPLAADWRWLDERPDTPWYPSMRLFRQRTFGNWSDVFARMRDELHALIADKPGSRAGRSRQDV